MSDKYEQAAVAGYILNILKKKSNSPAVKRIIVEWATGSGQDFVGMINPKAKNAFQQVVSSLEKFIRSRCKSPVSNLHRNITLLGKALKCDGIDTDILLLGARVRNEPVLKHMERLMEEVSNSSPLEFAAMMIGHEKSVLMEHLNQEALLCRTGVMRPASVKTYDHLDDCFNMPLPVSRALQKPHKNADSLFSDLAGKPEKPVLRWDDFSHMSEARDLIERIVGNALKKKSRGINILLYGLPGTGKTEFCRSLSGRLGHPLYSIAENSSDKDARLNKLHLVDSLLAGRRKALLLFDEMEDLLDHKGFMPRQGGSKVFLNRTLENNVSPVFWTTNDVQFFDPALLRRMTLIVEIKTPPQKARKGIWYAILKKENISLPADDVHSLSRVFDDSPAIVGNAVRAARLAGGGRECIEFVLQNNRKAMRRKQAKSAETRIEFNEALLNTDTDLSSLTCAAKSARKNFSLCLYGPPGTGKSAYVRHLAEEMGMEVLHLRASDLISPYVGETEQNIARAFERAKTEESFLVFDEADSFLQSRLLAQRTWEVTPVNEMLTWMETHPLPFACTTNLMERLDTAALRRFIFKVGFEYMTAEQVALCFRHFFHAVPPTGVLALDRLTPADFATVRNRAEIIGQSEDPEAIFSLLRQEQDMKPGSSAPIGFRA